MAKLIKTEYTVESDRISSPVRIALASDLHDGARAAKEASSMLCEDTPDLLCIVGDLFESPPRNPFSVKNAVAFLGALPKGLPVVYCRGNHDESESADVSAALAACSAVELDASAVSLCGIRIGGLRSALYRGRVPDLAFLDSFEQEEGFKLLLCHHPEYYPLYIKERKGIDLTLSGHAHGGQWKLLGRPIFAPGQGLFPKYVDGLIDGGRLCVGRGMHNSVRIPRIGVPTELVYLTLKPN
jgi:predicted MPP superfamily phosphohydrolase